MHDGAGDGEQQQLDVGVGLRLAPADGLLERGAGRPRAGPLHIVAFNAFASALSPSTMTVRTMPSPVGGVMNSASDDASEARSEPNAPVSGGRVVASIDCWSAAFTRCCLVGHRR